MSRNLVCLVFFWLSSLGLATGPITIKCNIAYRGLGTGEKSAIDGERNPRVREYALVILSDVRAHGAMTEIGAHGAIDREPLSWKWLGVAQERGQWRVVGYANPQHYVEPYDRLALAGKIPQIAVGTTTTGQMVIDGKELAKLPSKTRDEIVRALRLAFNPPRLRIADSLAKLNEARDADESPLLSQGAVSIVGGDHRAVSLFSFENTISPGAAEAEAAELNVQLAKGPMIIGRQSNGIPPYLDPKYRPTAFAPGGGGIKRGENDDKISRAHFMLKRHADGEGIVIVNGVPGKDVPVRAPIHGTRILSPEDRQLREGEEYLVKNGTSARIQLPNGTIIKIRANG